MVQKLNLNYLKLKNMLPIKQFKEWFISNGIDVVVPFPKPLINRLCKKALVHDHSLFCFLDKSFTFFRDNFLILKFSNWEEGFKLYNSPTTKILN